MIQLKLKLNSNSSKTVYAMNGKTYTLKPGSNVLNLEYEDYISLAKALNIKPIENKKKDQRTEDNKSAKPVAYDLTKADDNPKEELDKEEDSSNEVADTKEEDKEQERAGETSANKVKLEEPDKVEDVTENTSAEEVKTESVDYSTWTLKQLKAEYKKVTGETCKLKKDEVVLFLQEHQTNA